MMFINYFCDQTSWTELDSASCVSYTMSGHFYDRAKSLQTVL